MPRILHCIDTTGPGGAETIFTSLAYRFGTLPYSSFALIRGSGWIQGQLEKLDIAYRVEDCKGSFNFQFLNRLIGIIRSEKIDLIHSHLLGSNLYCSMAGAVLRKPAVSTFHGGVDISERERLGSLKFSIIRNFSTIVAVSDQLRTDLGKRMHMASDEIRLISNGIDCGRFVNAKPLGLRSQLQLPEKAVLIGSLGNIRVAKSYDTGIRTLQRLLSRGMDAHWFVAGQSDSSGRLLQELKRLSIELGVAERVHFLGFVEEPERFLKDIDALLLCSKSEGHPLALIQAMAAAKSIVATRCGVENVVPDGEFGWLAAVGDHEALAEKIEMLLGNPTEAARRARLGRQYVLNTYDNRVMFERYESLYGELLAKRNDFFGRRRLS